MAAYRHKNARLLTTLAATEFVRIEAMNVTTTSTAAAANHFSCSRSSPEDRANLTTTAATLTSSAAGNRMSIAISTGRVTAWLNEEVMGSDQTREAPTSTASVVSANTPPASQAAGRHRRERNRPFGKSSSVKANKAMGGTQAQLDSHMTARPSGSDPGAATRARSP